VGKNRREKLKNRMAKGAMNPFDVVAKKGKLKMEAISGKRQDLFTEKNEEMKPSTCGSGFGEGRSF